MNYRSPVASMERELETLEAELAELHAMAPPQPKSPPPRSHKAVATAERETRGLRKKLARLEKQIAAREKELGVRALTPREVASDAGMQRYAFGCVVIGVFVLSVHLLILSATTLVWTETACTIEPDDGVYVAHYEVGGETHQFVAGNLDEKLPANATCFVPVPSVLENVGQLTRPKTPRVGLRDRLSFLWCLGAGCAVALGLFLAVMNHIDRRKRETCQIEPDDFDAGD